MSLQAVSVILCLLAVVAPTTAASLPERKLADVASRYGFDSVLQTADGVVLRHGAETLAFYANSRKIELNGTLVWMNSPLTGSAAAWTLAEADAKVVLDPLLRADAVLRPLDIDTVVLDPGHGGEDTGALGPHQSCERTLTLDIAKRVRQRLVDSGLTVRMTRTRDRTVELKQRTAKAKRWAADLFVSIHLNSAPSCTATGIETYVLSSAGYPSTVSNHSDDTAYLGNGYDACNTLLGFFLQKGTLASTGAADRGLKRARFDVLRDAPCPAALIECGFLSNEPEERRLLDDAYRDKLAEGIARGILTFVGKTRSQALK